MATDTPDFWNEMWPEMGNHESGSDAILAKQVADMKPGRALEVGCGTGNNAIWLAKQGWQVTAIDFSDVAIERAKALADKQGANVEFVVADASTYQPQGAYDLITSFYIHLFPEQRVNMLSNMSKAMAHGGVLLFVSHDKSVPPSGWSDEDLLSLTSPGEIVAELSGLRIEHAFVLDHDAQGSHPSHMHDDEGRQHSHEEHGPGSSATTIVKAVRAAV